MSVIRDSHLFTHPQGIFRVTSVYDYCNRLGFNRDDDHFRASLRVVT
jgi:hypothetical protein